MLVRLVLMLIGVGVVIVHHSCQVEANREQRQVQEIRMDLSGAIDLDIGDASVIKKKLIETDESLIYTIQLIEYVDDKMYIFSQDKLSVYAMDGTFLYPIGKLGEGQGEYLSIKAFWIESGAVCVHDSKAGAVLKYTLTGDFVEKISCQSDDKITNYKYISPLKQDYYIASNVYHGSVPMQKYSVLDKKFKIKKKFGLLLENGMDYTIPFSRYKEELLYCEILNDTIFSITDQAVHPKYYVNFLTDKLIIPEYEPKEIMKYIRKIEMKDHALREKASLVSYASENDNHLIFCFRKGDYFYLAVYNKEQNSNKIYRLFSSSESVSMYQMFSKLLPDRVVFSCNIENPESRQDYHALIEIPIQD